VNPDTSVTGSYSSLPAGGGRAARAGRGAGRLTMIAEDNDDEEVIREEEEDDDDGRCSMTHATTIDKLMMSSQSGVEEDLDDLHITQL